ncbi:MAG: hypothetical protein OHK0022_20020 [Roseiflexaceae bacterium]
MLSPTQHAQALRIIARAATPEERRACPAFAPLPGQPAPARLDPWATAIAPLPLQALLDAEGLDPSRFACGLADVAVVDATALPDWACTLLMLLEQMGSHQVASGQPQTNLVSERVLRPLLDCGAAWLRDHSRRVELAPVAIEAMVANLARRLSLPLAAILDYELNQIRLLAPLLGASASAPSSLVGGSTADWLERLERFPVLGRLIGMAYAHWRDALDELLARLADDQHQIEARFFDGQPLGVLTGFRGDAGDRHDHGRTVAVLEFGERKLVYKPRDLRIAAAFLRLVETLNQAGPPLMLHTRPLWVRPGYTWDCYVAPAPCDSLAAVERFYQRVGMQIRLFQLLGASDLHADNLIACGEHPVCIDLEMVMHAPLHDDREGAHQQARHALGDSPLSGGLIVSYLLRGPWQRTDDIGVLAPARRLALPAESALEPGQPWDMTGHAPHLHGQPVAADGYLDQICAGYRAMQAFLLAQRGLLLDPAGPLHRCADACIRALHRDTQSYQQLLRQSLAPALLADCVQRELYLAGLLRDAVLQSDQPQHVRLIQSEIAALRDLDVPLLQAPVDQPALLLPDGRLLPGFLRASPLSLALERAAALPLFDGGRQEELLRTIFATGAHPPPPLPALPTPAPTPLDWLDEAIRLGDAILAAALRGPQGDLAWLGLTYRPAQDWRTLEVLLPDLLSGSCGLALVLAGLFRISGQTRFRDGAFGALAAARHALSELPARLDPLHQPGAPLRRPFFCGVFFGLGAQLYALQRCAQILDAPELAGAARAAADLLPIQQIVAHAPGDLVCGSAGLLLALLADPAPRPADHARAATVAELLLDGRAQRGAWISPPYPSSVRFLDTLPDTAGGLALAFQRLLASTGSTLPATLADRVQQALDELAALPDIPAPTTGALLARLALADNTQRDTLLAHAKAALPHEPSRLGSTALLGALQLALGAQRWGGGEHFRHAAEQYARILLARRHHTGSCFPDDHAADRQRLSALHGLGAVAHALLALHAPAQIATLNTLA